MKGIIYCAYNKINGKRYIGQTIQRLCERRSAHYNSGGSPYFHHALLKYNREDWEWKIIDEGERGEDLNNKERFWISFFETTDSTKGYNLCSGGQRNSMPTKEIIQKQRQNFINQYGTKYIHTKMPKNIRCIELNKVYKNAAQASKELGIHHGHITEVANGKLQSAGGYRWEWCIDLSFYPNAIYCVELEKIYYTFNQAKVEDNFSGVHLGRRFKKAQDSFEYAGFTFIKLNWTPNYTTAE